MDRADVAIVGSALGGLVAGAILARHGRRVVVLEHADTVGGRGGGVARDGWWLDFGHRDGHDVGDCQLVWHHGVAAAREADVALRLRRIAHPLRVHRMPEDTVVDGADWGPAGFLALARDVFECPADAVAELTALVRRLATATSAEVDAAIPLTLGPWLATTSSRPEVRRAVLRMATVIFHPRPEEASVGRLMQFFQTPKDGPFVADDDEAGGMQGLMEPWARAIRARGGEIALGWKPVEIAVDDGRVRGVVAVDRGNVVRTVEAPVVISTYPLWENRALVALPPALLETAVALERHQADLVGWHAGLRRLPVVRATGRVEAHDGWNRLLAGPERAYRGGWHVPSIASRHVAPPGMHLLSLVMARFLPRVEPWSTARAQLDESVAYLRRFYADLDDCLIWAAHQWVTAPQSTSWAWAPVRRHDVAVPGIDGLLLVGSTVEAPAGLVDLAAWAGRAAAQHALGML